jgi:hypothetical protein
VRESSWPTWLSSRCQSMVNTSMRYPFLLRRVSASQCTLLAGCGMSGLRSMAPKATSSGPPLAQWSGILRLIYRLVFITIYPTHKASHISASKDPSMLNAHSMSGPFLLDPDLVDDRTSDSSAISIRRADFAQGVTDCDGTCLMTGATSNFQACHIIPHAKGNQVCSEYLNHSQFSFQAQYINSLADHRNVLDPPLDDINDPRNGILLQVTLHRPFGASMVAFLQVSYFAQLSSMWLN